MVDEGTKIGRDPPNVLRVATEVNAGAIFGVSLYPAGRVKTDVLPGMMPLCMKVSPEMSEYDCNCLDRGGLDWLNEGGYNGVDAGVAF